jgi:S-adenosylmethionine synthetase
MNMPRKFFFTSESMTEGHPDKICDQISDAILDNIIEQDPDARVACETMAGMGFIIVTGEITTKAQYNADKIVRNVLEKVGYTKPEYGFYYKSVGVLIAIHEQSPDIAMGVDENTKEDIGAGDQGMMSGYATNETKELMPTPIILAHKIAKKLSDVRKDGTLDYLRPDGKTQVTVEYEDHKPKRIDAVVVSTQHNPDVKIDDLRKDIKEEVIKPVCGNLLDEDTKYFINNTGRFVLGGPVADAGCTGRKIIADTYGGVGGHGGGAFSGKDSTKVDKSGAYMARYIAKNIVAAGLAERCEVQISYVIGGREPIKLFINTFNTSTVPQEKIYDAVKKLFDLTPVGIIKKLDLRKPIYKKTSVYGHFGREEFTWEKTDMTEELKKEVIH